MDSRTPMFTLHDPNERQAIRERIGKLRPDSPRQFGKMTVDQMLWHVNCSVANALGQYPIAKIRLPVPKFVLKWMVISRPWRKGNTPTAPELKATDAHDFQREREKLLRLIDEFAAKPLSAKWNDSALLGAMSGDEWSRLMRKHVDHHLQQFGV